MEGETMPTNNHLIALLDRATVYETTKRCKAVQLEEKTRVYAVEGPVNARSGQWLVMVDGAGIEVVDDAVFRGEWRKVVTAAGALAPTTGPRMGG